MAQYPVALQVHIGVKDLAKAADAKWNGTANTWEARNAAALYKCRRWAPPSQRLGLYWKENGWTCPSLERNRRRLQVQDLTRNTLAGMHRWGAQRCHLI